MLRRAGALPPAERSRCPRRVGHCSASSWIHRAPVDRSIPVEEEERDNDERIPSVMLYRNRFGSQIWVLPENQANKSRGSTHIKSRGPDLGAPAGVALQQQDYVRLVIIWSRRKHITYYFHRRSDEWNQKYYYTIYHHKVTVTNTTVNWNFRNVTV
jgi:hypothetical protein